MKQTNECPSHVSYYERHKEECKERARKYYKKRKMSIKLKAKTKYKMTASTVLRKRHKKYVSDAVWAENKRQYNRERNKRLRATKSTKNDNE